jgi:hypothetical protein
MDDQNVQLDMSTAQPITPSPSGVTLDMSTAQPIAQPPTQHSWLGNQMQQIKDLGAGIDEGMTNTVHGAMHLANTVANAPANALAPYLPQSLQQNIQNNQQQESKPEQFLQQHNQQVQQSVENPGIAKAGEGVESLAEFLIPGEGEVNAAGKAMSYADRLAEGAKAAKLIEGHAGLQKIVKAGVKALATGGEQAGIQGAQTFVKTGGDVGQSAESAGAAGLVGGALGGAGSLVTDALGKGGQAGEAVSRLADAANQSPERKEVAQNLADTINSNESSLKADYGNKLQHFQEETKGVTVPYKNSPLHQTVQDLLDKGEGDATPFDSALNKSRPGSQRVNDTLQELNDLGKEPEAPKPETWVDNNGVTHTEEAPAAEPAKPIDMDMKTLLDQRKLIGERLRSVKGLTSDDLADKKVYGQLLDGIDGNIDQLVQKADKPDVTKEYEFLRQNYKEHIGAFSDNSIKRLTDPRGVPDDAMRDFIGQLSQSGVVRSGVKQRNLDTLSKVLDPFRTEGDKPLKELGKQAFGVLMKDSTDATGFNASKFMDKWSKIDPATKERLFDTGNPESTLQSLASDAHSVRNVQRLVRLGLISAASPAAAAFPHAAGVLGTAALIGEASGTHAARNYIDFVANHPAVWKTLKAGSQFAENPEVQQGAADATRVAAHEAGQAVTSPPPAPDDNPTPGTQPVRKMDSPKETKAPASDLTFDTGSMAGKPVDGLVQKGNIDLNHRPQIKNEDGSSSTIFSMTVPVNKDGSVFKGKYEDAPQYALVPSIANGKFLTPDGRKPNERNHKQMSQLEDAATDHYGKTREHLGLFKTSEDADKYAGLTHAYGADGTDKKVYVPSPK